MEYTAKIKIFLVQTLLWSPEVVIQIIFEHNTITVWNLAWSYGSCSSSILSLEVFPQNKSCWSCRQLLYITRLFLSPLFLCFFLEFQNLLLSVPSVLSCVLFCSLYLFHPSILFYSSFYSLFCFLPLFIHFILWSPLLFSFQICQLSFLFSFPYSILSASPLCSITTQSVLFLAVLFLSFFLDRSLYLRLLCYLFCSCICFL